MLYREQTFSPRAFHSELQQQTNTVNNTVNTEKSPPWACDKGCAEACAERFSTLKSEFPGIVPRKQSFRFQYREFPRVFIRKSGVLAMSIFYSGVKNYRCETERRFYEFKSNFGLFR